MTASNQNVTMFSGDTRTLQYTISDSDDAPLDLTGVALAWRCARKFSGGFGAAVVSKSIGTGITVTNAAQGKADVALSPADTAALAGRYYHELELTDAGGNVSTVATGTLTIIKDLVAA